MSTTVIANGTASHATARRRRGRHGFTLIEAMLVTVIIGVGCVAMLGLLAAGTVANGESTETTTAVNFANGINELTANTPYAQLRTIGSSTGRTYQPPIDGLGNDLTGHPEWSQTVTVRYVMPTNLNFAVPESQIEPTSKFTVAVKKNGVTVYTTSWIVTTNAH